MFPVAFDDRETPTVVRQREGLQLRDLVAAQIGDLTGGIAVQSLIPKAPDLCRVVGQNVGEVLAVARPPATPGSFVGEEARMPYTTEYYFYKAS